jgi:hypothetical protein
MTTRPDFDLVVADWLAGTAGAAAPDYLDEALERASAVRQRPWWSGPERWLPMFVSARTASWAPSPRLGRILLVAVVVLALVGLAIVAVGSQHHVPAPFGPAKNGMLAFSVSGHIETLDSIDGTPRAVISGATDDFGPSFTRDGTQLVFGRGSCETGGSTLMVANADGSNARPIVQLAECPSSMDVSPDGSVVAFAGIYGGERGIYLLRTDGTDTPHRLKVAASNVGWPMWRPPDAHQLLYFDWDDDELRLHGILPDGSGDQPIADLGLLQSSTLDQLDPSLTADGRSLVYAANDGDLFRNHLVDLQTGVDRSLSLGPAGNHELHGQLSPDGTKLLFHDADPSVSGIQEMLAPLDGSAPAVPIGPLVSLVDGSANLSQEFSPDGRSIVLISGNDNVLRIVDASTGGIGRTPNWGTADLPGWQRLAP